jgi:hypothetical protein
MSLLNSENPYVMILRWRNVMAIGNLEIRMAHLEGAYEQINERLLLSRMDRQFFWLLGLLSVSIFLPIARSLGR